MLDYLAKRETRREEGKGIGKGKGKCLWILGTPRPFALYLWTHPAAHPTAINRSIIQSGIDDAGDIDGDGVGDVEITPAVLKAAALAHDGYETPALNDRLYLHYRVRFFKRLWLGGVAGSYI